MTAIRVHTRKTLGTRATAGVRRAFSLIEVLLATSILLGSLVVLEELARLGRRHAVNAEETATAQTFARAKLNEMLCGASPLKPVDEEPIDEAGDWVYHVAVEPAETPGLLEVAVTVAKADSSAGGTFRRTEAAAPSDSPRAQRSFTLVQWVREPADSGGASGRGDRLPSRRPRGDRPSVGSAGR